AVPEPLRKAHCQQALVAGVAVRHDRFRAVVVDDVVEALRDLSERLVPRDLLELPVALGADAPQWMQHSVVAVHTVEELVDLRTQLALAVRMAGVTAHLQRDRCGPTAIDGDMPAARVGTIVMACSADDVGRCSPGCAHGRTLDACRRFSFSRWSFRRA